MTVPDNRPILTAATMRAAEAAAIEAGDSVATLMDRAGKAVADEVNRFALGRPILMLAGPGNNGGDAFVAARYLTAIGHDVMVAAVGEPRGDDSAAARAKWTGKTVALGDAPTRPVVVDGLFGTGLSRPLGPDIAKPLARVVGGAEFALAIDLPSGVDADTGADLGAAEGFAATLALGAMKPAHVIGKAAGMCGRILLADIGVPVHSQVQTLARPALRPPLRDDQKFTRGMVVVIDGAMPGAARLAARAAMHGGAGYVVLASKNGGQPDALVHWPVDDPAALADKLADERIGAVVVGPGLGRDDRARDLLAVALACRHPLVVDGDALSLLGKDATQRLSTRPEVAITPHAGEFARLFDPSKAGKIDSTLAAAAAIGGTVVHKGPDTVIGNADGTAGVLSASSSWLSTAGTGDVLAGLLAARRATGATFPQAAAEAIWLHARAATLAGPAFAADDLIGRISSAIGECL